MIRFLVFAAVFSCAFVARSENMFSEVIRRIEAASDPKGMIKGCKSFYSSQRVLGEKSGDIVVTALFKAPDMYRVTTYSKGIPVRIRLIKGSDVWDFHVETSKEGSPEVILKKVTGTELSYALMQASLANPRISISETFVNIAVSTRVVDGVSYYKLTSIPKSKENGVIEIYADTKTFLKKAFLFKRKKEGVAFDVKMEIKSYHDIGGALVPQLTQLEVGESIQMLKLIEYKLNSEIPETEFDVDSIMSQLKVLF